MSTPEAEDLRLFISTPLTPRRLLPGAGDHFAPFVFWSRQCCNSGLGKQLPSEGYKSLEQSHLPAKQEGPSSLSLQGSTCYFGGCLPVWKPGGGVV